LKGLRLAVATNLVQQLMDWVRGETATDLVNGSTLIGAIGSFIGTLKWLTGREPRSVGAGDCLIGRTRISQRPLPDGNLRIVQPLFCKFLRWRS
jgi:hypothetical protein